MALKTVFWRTWKKMLVMSSRFGIWGKPSQLDTQKYTTQILIVASILIVVFSLLGIQIIVDQIANDEAKKVRMWASSVQQKAELITYSKEFFDQIEVLDKNNMEDWAEAYVKYLEARNPTEYEIYRQIVERNATIPCIITDENMKILHCQNTDSSCYFAKYLEDDMLAEYSRHAPILTDFWNQTWYIFYKQSNIFYQLQEVLDELTNSFMTEIVDNSIFAPMLVVSSDEKRVIHAGNITADKYTNPLALERTLGRMRSQNAPIQLVVSSEEEYLIFYEDSIILSRLTYIPLIFLIVIIAFVFSVVWTLRASKRSENDKLWVGMSRETAHQLGTPISSLMAWMEYLKEKNMDSEALIEIQKDIDRLKMITERFSKIGSEPTMSKENVVRVVHEAISYLQSRLPRKIRFDVVCTPSADISANINPRLLEWVLENLFKNATDAIGTNEGIIQVQISDGPKNVIIDVTDDGKGIPKDKWKSVFNAGYTTKTRGWGLGLSLNRRIINDYHKGKIFVKQSLPDKGTTFRIILYK